MKHDPTDRIDRIYIGNEIDDEVDRQLDEWLRRATTDYGQVEPIAGFEGRLLACLEAQAAAEPASKVTAIGRGGGLRRMGRGYRLAAAAAVALLLALAGYGLWSPPRGVERADGHAAAPIIAPGHELADVAVNEVVHVSVPSSSTASSRAPARVAVEPSVVALARPHAVVQESTTRQPADVKLQPERRNRKFVFSSPRKKGGSWFLAKEPTKQVRDLMTFVRALPPEAVSKGNGGYVSESWQIDEVKLPEFKLDTFTLLSFTLNDTGEIISENGRKL